MEEDLLQKRKERIGKFLYSYPDMFIMSNSIMLMSHDITLRKLVIMKVAYQNLEISRKKVIQSHVNDSFLERLYSMKGLVI